MNIFFHEFRHYLKSSLYYLLGMILTATVYFSFYPMFSSDVANFLKLMQNFPPEMQQALGLDFLNLSSILGYYSFMMVFIALVAAVWTMNLGVSILSREEREKTADFLFTRPASRMKIVASKLAAALSLIVLNNLVYFPAAWLILTLISGGTFGLKTFILLNLSLLFLELFFLSLGFLIGVFLRRIKSTISLSLGAVFGLFAIGAFGVTESDDPLRFLAPFKYFDSNHILVKGSVEWLYPALGLAACVLFVSVACVIAVRKDLEGV